MINQLALDRFINYINLEKSEEPSALAFGSDDILFKEEKEYLIKNIYNWIDGQIGLKEAKEFMCYLYLNLKHFRYTGTILKGISISDNSWGNNSLTSYTNSLEIARGFSMFHKEPESAYIIGVDIERNGNRDGAMGALDLSGLLSFIMEKNMLEDEELLNKIEEFSGESELLYPLNLEEVYVMKVMPMINIKKLGR